MNLFTVESELYNYSFDICISFFNFLFIIISNSFSFVFSFAFLDMLNHLLIMTNSNLEIILKLLILINTMFFQL